MTLAMSPVNASVAPSTAELTLELARAGARLIGDASVRVRDVRQDSRRIAPGDLFAARPGAAAQGASFARDAVARGAVAVLCERGAPLPDVGVPLIEVRDVRLAIALAAEAVHGFPSRTIDVVGITGTNGKTTTSFLAVHALSGAGARAARLGTLGFAFEHDVVDSPLTTPEADEISRYAARVRDAGGTHLVMEASSHALAQGRVEALRFAAAVFTNLTQDHLDFHGTMDDYAAAKLRLFTELSPELSVVNVDDPFGASIAARAPGRVIRVSKRELGGDVFPRGVRIDARGIAAEVVCADREVLLESRLVGEHNLDNLLATLALVHGLGLDVARAAAALASAPMVPGRLERTDAEGDDIVVLVDYAHTPDALERALSAARRLTAGELICVFGCGGDRDPLKRPKMGDAVGRLASRSLVTNDNPRSEDPRAIADAILPGLRAHGAKFEVELDRALAIERAILAAEPGDVVLIAGKGHEPYQILGSVRRSFDDRDESRRALALRRKGRAE
jgi:UDP-N-acetylmuramoyl-L-alanyl-D-glutamate--2,6-diaminopimelate ligase